MPKVTIYTQAYNSGKYLEPCIKSVLAQTYTDFEWILIDHGSKDETPSVIDRYAKQDQRIIPVHIAVNGSVPGLLYDALRNNGTGKYLAWIDSDDWWDLDYLERLVPFTEENDLDLALTGAVQYFQRQGISSPMRQREKPAVMTLKDFARNFPAVGSFAGALWANLRPTEKVLAMQGDPQDIADGKEHLMWRADTLHMLTYLNHCRRIGINEFAPYHYRRYEGSQSGQYTDNFFQSNIYFYQRLEGFFRQHHVLDEEMRTFLNHRYFFEMISTVGVLKNASMPADEKIRICAGIAAHPLTIQALPYHCQHQNEWRTRIADIAADALLSRQFSEIDLLRELLRPLAPDCWDVVTAAGAALFAREQDLIPLLFHNNRKALEQRFLELIEREDQPERYDLGIMLQKVLPGQSPLRQVSDVRFFKQYPRLTRLILGGGYLAALDQMTALLLEELPLKSEESFLQVYLTLAALENQAPAFLFGKLRLAKLCQREGRLEECRALLGELEEMGADLPGMDELKAACGGEALS